MDLILIITGLTFLILFIYLWYILLRGREMSNAILQYSLYLIILVLLAIPLGKYIGKVMNEEKVFLSKLILPCENFIYKVLGINEEDMDWKNIHFQF